MRLTRKMLLGLALAVPMAVGPAAAQQPQQPSLLDQARRALGATDDQDAQRRAYEAGRRDEQERQNQRDRDRRAGPSNDRRGYEADRRGSDDRRGYEAERRGYDADRRGSDDRRGYEAGSDRSGRPAPGYGGGPYGDRESGSGYRR